MRNIRLLVSYDGTDFHGWQRQPKLPTIQECLESALSRLTNERTCVWGSGRTDAGVHALSQFANFKTACPIPCENLVKALNDLLPPSVRVKQAAEASDDFHARYHARSKTYRYRILLAPVCSPFLWRFVCHHPFPLDVRAMAEAARHFEGTHDFTAFAAVSDRDSEAASLAGSREAGSEMVRTIFSSHLTKRLRTSILIYKVSGNGFLHHMVRNIVGTLMEVGRGRLVPTDIPRILKARDRTLAGPTAPAAGLCLVKVDY
jgi:tRNA pseudouridine38-40 synthase